MLIYKINKQDLSPDQQIWIDNFHSGLTAVLQKSVDANGRDLLLDYEVAVTRRDTKFLTFDSNAAFGIPGSLSIEADASRYASDKAESDRFSIRIKLTFTKKAQAGPQQAKKSPEDEESKMTFHPTTPRYTFDQIILPDDTRKSILDALGVVAHRELVYEKWGFGVCDPTPNSILSFYGPPGTGKTMCAHAIANYLHKPLLAFNYAEIESKYVGEAAKNLKRAFEEASRQDAVMFFDEADSFLGKRIGNVDSGHDQSINSQRSQMLIYLEEFKGVVIFATNLQSNYDKAFESRIVAHIKLDLPNREARADILRHLIPAHLPLDHTFTDEDLLAIADKMDGLAGREIKQGVKQLLFRKASESGEQAVFSVQDFADAMAAKLKEKKNLDLESEINKRKEEEKKRKDTLDALARDGKRRMEYLDSCSLDALESAIKRKKEKAEKEEKENAEKEKNINEAVNGEAESKPSSETSTPTPSISTPETSTSETPTPTPEA